MRCRQSKANSQFSSKANEHGNLKSWCRECCSDYQKQYAKARRSDPEYSGSKWGRQFATYGVSPADYDEILRVQGGVCAGCGSAPSETGRRLDIDHKHQERERCREAWERFEHVRGVLCHLCNRILGLARDRVEVLLALAAYLQRPPATPVVLEKMRSVVAYLERFEAVDRE